ncbi:MAG: PspC domain-containing protein, partial [Pseudomonadota bacterium]
MSVEKKLYLDKENAKVSGVCAGIADYLDMDPILVRIVFVLALIFGFMIAMIMYFVLAAVLKPKPASAPTTLVRIPKETITQQLDMLESSLLEVDNTLN